MAEADHEWVRGGLLLDLKRWPTAGFYVGPLTLADASSPGPRPVTFTFGIRGDVVEFRHGTTSGSGKK